MARSHLKFVPLVCLLVAIAGCDVFTSDAERVARAEQALDQGDFGRAMVELNTVIQKHPKDARAQFALARATFLVGNSDAATRALDVAAQGNIDKAEIAWMRARIALSTGKADELLRSIDSGAGDLVEPLRSLARLQALGELRRLPEAIELAQRLRNDPTVGARAAVVLAHGYAQLGNAEGGLAVLDEALKRQSQSAEAWLARGRLLQLMQRRPEAVASWRNAAQYARGELTVVQKLNMGSALIGVELEGNDLDAARAALLQMRHDAPDGAVPVEIAAARLEVADGKPAAAIARLEKIGARDAGVGEATPMLASAHLAAGNREQALQLVNVFAQHAEGNAAMTQVAANLRAMAKYPADSDQLVLSVGAVQILLGQPMVARQLLTRHLAGAKDPARINAALAQMELSLGNGAEGLRIAESLVKQDSSSLAAQALLAQALRVNHRYPEAAAALENLFASKPSAGTAAALASVRREGKLGHVAEAYAAWTTNHPDDFAMRGAYADALRVAGDNKGAVAEYEKLVAAHGESIAALNNLAWLYYLVGDARALATAKRAYTLAPRVPSVADTYGWLLVESGAVREGANVLETAYQEGGAANPDVRYHYAAALMRAGDKDRAAPILAALLAEPTPFESRTDALALQASLK